MKHMVVFSSFFTEPTLGHVMAWPLLSLASDVVQVQGKEARARADSSLSSTSFLMCGCCVRTPVAMSFPVLSVPNWEHVGCHSHGCLMAKPWEVPRKQSIRGGGEKCEFVARKRLKRRRQC